MPYYEDEEEDDKNMMSPEDQAAEDEDNQDEEDATDGEEVGQDDEESDEDEPALRAPQRTFERNAGGKRCMTKNQMINHLINNGGYEAEDRDFLAAVPTAKLQRLAASVGEPSVLDKLMNNNEQEELSLEDYIDRAPPAVREALIANMQVIEEKKNGLVQAIVADKRNRFNEEFLVNCSVDVLEGIAALAGPTGFTANRTLNYFGGAGSGNQEVGITKEKALPIPTMNFRTNDDEPIARKNRRKHA